MAVSAARCEFRLPQWYAQHDSSSGDDEAEYDSEPADDSSDRDSSEGSEGEEADAPIVTTAVTQTRPTRKPKPPAPAAREYDTGAGVVAAALVVALLAWLSGGYIGTVRIEDDCNDHGSHSGEPQTLGIGQTPLLTDAKHDSTLVPVLRWTVHALNHDLRYEVFHTHANVYPHATRTEAWNATTGAPLWVLWAGWSDVVHLRIYREQTGEALCVYSDAASLGLTLPDWHDKLSPGYGISVSPVQRDQVSRSAMHPPRLCPGPLDVSCVELPDAHQGNDVLPLAARAAHVHQSRYGQPLWVTEAVRLFGTLRLRVTRLRTEAQFNQTTDGGLVLHGAPSRSAGGYAFALWDDCESETIWRGLCLLLRACIADKGQTFPSFQAPRGKKPDAEDAPPCPWRFPNGTLYHRVPCECLRDTYSRMELAEGGFCPPCHTGHNEGCGCWARWLWVEQLLLHQACVQPLRCVSGTLRLPCVGDAHQLGVCVAPSVVPCLVGTPRFRELIHATTETLRIL